MQKLKVFWREKHLNTELLLAKMKIVQKQYLKEQELLIYALIMQTLMEYIDNSLVALQPLDSEVKNIENLVHFAFPLGKSEAYQYFVDCN